MVMLILMRVSWENIFVLLDLILVDYEVVNLNEFIVGGSGSSLLVVME